jgi:hypothetical protein
LNIMLGEISLIFNCYKAIQGPNSALSSEMHLDIRV